MVVNNPDEPAVNTPPPCRPSRPMPLAMVAANRHATAERSLHPRRRSKSPRSVRGPARPAAYDPRRQLTSSTSRSPISPSSTWSTLMEGLQLELAGEYRHGRDAGRDRSTLPRATDPNAGEESDGAPIAACRNTNADRGAEHRRIRASSATRGRHRRARRAIGAAATRSTQEMMMAPRRGAAWKCSRTTNAPSGCRCASAYLIFSRPRAFEFRRIRTPG